jgi:hypothetical protein
MNVSVNRTKRNKNLVVMHLCTFHVLPILGLVVERNIIFGGVSPALSPDLAIGEVDVLDEQVCIEWV